MHIACMLGHKTKQNKFVCSLKEMAIKVVNGNSITRGKDK